MGHPANPEPDAATRANPARTGGNQTPNGRAGSNLGSSPATFGGGWNGGTKSLVTCTYSGGHGRWSPWSPQRSHDLWQRLFGHRGRDRRLGVAGLPAGLVRGNRSVLLGAAGAPLPGRSEPWRLHGESRPSAVQSTFWPEGLPASPSPSPDRRGGLDDPRGNLAIEFCRLAGRLRPRWIVWENVPGVLSSNGGRDFGSILGTLAELGYGCAWRVLDAQFFGVPQRRRRVFVVGHLGDWRRAAAVLLEREGLCRDTPARRKAREVTALTRMAWHVARTIRPWRALIPSVSNDARGR